MGHRVLVMLSSVVLMCTAQLAFTMGLGDITLKSTLNQPLSAEIELLEVRDLSEREILVGLASQEDFERIGVDKPFFLSNLKFEVQLGTPKGDLVLVTSRKPVKEPFLNFIVQVRWPSGKLLREYTLLMDLPALSDRKAAPVTAAQTTPSTPRATSAPAQSKELADGSRFVPRSSFGEQTQAPADQPAPTQDYSGGTTVDVYGPVKSNDTLWEIADNVRPDRSVSVQQTMLAIQDLNPGAFINNNINLLRKGQILRIPTREQIVQTSEGQAVEMVAEQNVAWSGGSSDGDVGAAQLEGRRSYSSRDTETTDPEGRVRLTSPEDASDVYEGRGSGSGESSNEALENELAITLEQLDKSSKENTELRSKVQSLEEQIETMERMIEVSNEEMRALELSVQKTKEEALAAAETDTATEEAGQSVDPLSMGLDPSEIVPEEAAPEEVAPEEIASADDPTDIIGETQTDVGVQPEVEQVAVVEATPEPRIEPTPAPKRQPERVVSQPVKEKGIVDLLMEYLPFIGLGIVVIGAGAFFLIRRRSGEEKDEFEDDFLDQTVFEEPQYDEPEEQVIEEQVDVPIEEFEDITTEEVEEETPTESETGDAVAEADIYIAYGKYDQAEEMLVNALNKEPANTDIRLKLLEVYASQQDLESFDPQFAKLIAIGSNEATDRGHQLRNSIAGSGDFDPSLYETSDVAIEESLDAELDLGSDFSTDFESEGGSGELDLDLDLDSDFSLDADQDVDTELTLDTDSELSLDGDFGDLESVASTDESLDFDLDLEGESPADDVTVLKSNVEDVNESEELLDLDLDLDFEESSASIESADDNSLDLDLDFDLDDSASDSGEENDDLSLDFDLDLPEGSDDSELNLEDGLDLELEEPKADDEKASSDELSLDFDLDIDGDADSESDVTSVDLEFDSEELSTESSEEDLSSLDFDLEGLDDIAPLEESGELTTEDSDLELDFGEDDVSEDLPSEASSDDFDLELEEDASDSATETLDLADEIELGSSDETEGGLEFDLEGLDELDAELNVTGESLDDFEDLDDLELPGDIEDLDSASAPEATQADESIDDLDLGDDLDLSELDKELDELASDMGDSDLESLGLEDASEESVNQSSAEELDLDTVTLDEPVTEFDEDIDLEDAIDELPLPEPETVTLETEEAANEPEAEELDVADFGEDTMFNQAISEVPETSLDFEIPEVDPESLDDDNELGFLNDSDETATKLDLARAYIDMGDAEGAKDILDEIRSEGNDQQREEAEKLAERLP